MLATALKYITMLSTVSKNVAMMSSYHQVLKDIKLCFNEFVKDNYDFRPVKHFAFNYIP